MKFQIKSKLEECEKKGALSSEKVAKLTNELAELSERLEDLKESFDSRDSNRQDTSPVVRIRSALQSIKEEIAAYDLRIGVVSHSLLAARVAVTARKRIGAAKSAKKRQSKLGARKGYGAEEDLSGGSDDDLMY